MRKIGRCNKELKELLYIIKWKGYAEDKNRWDPPEWLGNTQELVEEFHGENRKMPGLVPVE